MEMKVIEVEKNESCVEWVAYVVTEATQNHGGIWSGQKTDKEAPKAVLIKDRETVTTRKGE